MFQEFPVERTCTHRYQPFQLTFARHALQLLPRPKDVLFEADHCGLLLRGKTEAALDRPIRILKAYYGNEIDIGAAKIRLHEGSTLEEPYMGLGILCARQNAQAVKDDLRERDAVIFDEEAAPQFSVIRATAPLAKLLGYVQHVSDLGAGASAIMWLSHYAPARPPSTGETVSARLIRKPFPSALDFNLT